MPFQVTVTADAGNFKTGTVLKAPRVIAAYYRTMMNVGRDTADETKLTDDQIMQVVRVVDGDTADAEIDRLERLEAREQTEDDTDVDAKLGTTAEQSPAVRAAPAATADAKREETDFRAWAIREASVFTKDDAFKAKIMNVIDAKKTVNFAPLALMLDIRRLQPDEATRKRWPMPGSKRPDGYTGNDKFGFDIVKIPVEVEGEIKERRVSFYDVMFETVFPQFAATIKDIDGASNTPGSPYGKDKMADWEKKTVRSDYVTDQTTGRTNFRKGVALDKQFLEVKDLPGIMVGFRKDKDDVTPLKTNAPIVLSFTAGSDPTKHKYSSYTVSEFLRMDPDAARDPEYVKENGSVYAALVMSGKAEPVPPEEKIKVDLKTFAPGLGVFLGWFKDDEHEAAWRRRVSTENDETNHELVTVIDFYLLCKGIAENPGYWRRYQKTIGAMKNADGSKEVQPAQTAA